MTLVVMTSEFILADSRVTCKIQTTDALGKNVIIQGTTDEYCKLGSWSMSTSDFETFGYAIFGDVDTAMALVKYIRSVGMVDLKEKLDALSGFKIKLPALPSGVAWVTEDRRLMWVTIDASGYVINKAPEGTEYIALGTGAELFIKTFTDVSNIMTAFLVAAKEDPQSTHEVYDRFDVETAHISRFRQPGGDVPKQLEELLTGGM